MGMDHTVNFGDPHLRVIIVRDFEPVLFLALAAVNLKLILVFHCCRYKLCK